MDADLAARVLVDWLESEVSRAVTDRGIVGLAYSGGLGSTLLAAIARKRCDLTCYVVGVKDAPDLRAADRAHMFLDYRIEPIRLTPANCLALARRIVAAKPEATLKDVLAIAPAWAVRERVDSGGLLAGFGASTDPGTAVHWLPDLRITTPLLRLRPEAGPSHRSRLTACAEILGLPPAFGNPRRRPPESGSGMERALRALAASRRTTLKRLVHARTTPAGINRRPPRPD